MEFSEKLAKKSPTISYEFFPPKTAKGWSTLYSTLADISSSNPDFVSVTYGAGGTTRDKTLDLVRRIKNELNIETMAHLTCVGHSQNEIKEILGEFKNCGIQYIIALRGDPPKGEAKFVPHPEGFAHASNLIEFTKANFDFTIAAACYPEKHIEAVSLESDIGFLKEKQEKGATFAITQLFFNNDDFYRFRDKAIKQGVTIPIIAGIMPVTSLKQLQRFEEMAGAKIPENLVSFLKKSDDVVQQGIEYGSVQCQGLLENDVAGVHLYTLNQSKSSLKITQKLRELGYFPNSHV